MNWSTTIPQIVSAFVNLSEFTAKTIAERVLTMMLAILIVGGVSVFAVMAFAWLWIKQAVGELHPALSVARYDGAKPGD